jgi:hypothetical protein
MASWPDSLPSYFLRGSYQEELLDSTLSTEMDAGPPKERLRFTAGIKPLSGAIRISLAQRETLDTFYYETVRQRTLPFTMPHPITREDITVKFAAAPSYSDGPPGKFTARLAFSIQP